MFGAHHWFSIQFLATTVQLLAQRQSWSTVCIGSMTVKKPSYPTAALSSRPVDDFIPATKIFAPKNPLLRRDELREFPGLQSGISWPYSACSIELSSFTEMYCLETIRIMIPKLRWEMVHGFVQGYHFVPLNSCKFMSTSRLRKLNILVKMAYRLKPDLVIRGRLSVRRGERGRLRGSTGRVAKPKKKYNDEDDFEGDGDYGSPSRRGYPWH